jgi:hypothetical protein
MINQRLCKVYFSICLALFACKGEASESNILGRAFDQESGLFLYSEHHSCGEEAIECSVDYRDDSGDLMVRKELNYRDSRYGPALRIQDYRTQTTLIVESAKRKGVVVDAGFDNFVRSKWSSLSAGERVKFPFLVVGFDEPLNMMAKLDNSRPCTLQNLCLEIALDSWLLGLLAKPIGLDYSKEEQKLLRYQGISNIRTADGEALYVDIHYQYGERGAIDISTVQPRPVTLHF